ncbi:Inositol monophosphatase [Aphelenchoides fujianensis]|nr:Inositol monophosphatase [Aphelenchoides fujianensis]
MIDAARKAARGLARDFGEVTELQVSKKGAADFVSNADLKAEQTLFEILTKARPGYGFLGEERGMVEGTDKTHTWIVDPLDGTTNFLHAIPHFAVNIALQREGEGIVAGVTYNPISNDLFWVEKGKGASILATGIPFAGKPGHAQFLKELHQVSQKVAGVRRFGSAALDLAWVAAGRFDAYWERNLNPWDVAAGILMIQESGGKITTIDENDHDLVAGKSILASNQDLHPQILERLRAA